jgi:hypothetical protein
VEIRVSGVQDAVQVAPSPAQSDVDPDPQGDGDSSEGVVLDAPKAAALESAHDLALDTGSACDVDLAKMPVDADGAEGVADSDIVHVAIVPSSPSRRLR